MAVADVNSTIRHSGLPDGVQKQVYFEEYKVPFIVTYYKIACRLSMFVRLIERHVWRSILSREHFYRLMRALSDLPTVFPQALSTLLATVCPLRSVKHPRIIRLLYIHKKEEIDVTSQKSWWVTLVFFIHFPQKNPKNNQKKQRVTSSGSSSFLVSSFDFLSSFLSAVASFSFFFSAAGAMLKSIVSEVRADSWDFLPNLLPVFPAK